MINFGLPSEMIFSFNVETPNMPEIMEMQTGGVKKPSDKLSKNLSGKIKVTYSNYEVNKGISDSFFENKKDKDKLKKQK